MSETISDTSDLIMTHRGVGERLCVKGAGAAAAVNREDELRLMHEDMVSSLLSVIYDIRCRV